MLEHYETHNDSGLVILTCKLYELLRLYSLIFGDHTLRSRFPGLALAELCKLGWIQLSPYTFFLLRISHYRKHWNSTQNSTPISIPLGWYSYVPLWVPSLHFMSISSWILKFDLFSFFIQSTISVSPSLKLDSDSITLHPYVMDLIPAFYLEYIWLLWPYKCLIWFPWHIWYIVLLTPF